MTDEPMAIAGTRRSAKEMVDGTLRVSIDIEPNDKARFHKLFPEIDMPIAIVPLALGADMTPERPQLATKPYGEQAKMLRLSGFFYTPKVWEAIGSDKEFQAWVRITMPCIICGDRDFTSDDGIGRTEFAHVRRAGEAGTGYKPEYSGVPLCHKHHGIQHQHGETKAFREFQLIKKGFEQQVTLDQAKEWFDIKRTATVFAWCWDILKRQLNRESWADLEPEILYSWASENNLITFLPDCYRSAE